MEQEKGSALKHLIVDMTLQMGARYEAGLRFFTRQQSEFW